MADRRHQARPLDNPSGCLLVGPRRRRPAGLLRRLLALLGLRRTQR